MADQQTTQASLINAVNTYYELQILQDFDKKAVWYSNAPYKKPIPQGSGNIIQFTRYNKINPLFSDDSDEFSSTQSYLSAQVITANLHERSSYVQISRTVSLTAIGDALEQASRKAQDQAVKSLDVMIRNDIGMAVADVANASSVNMNNLAIDGGTLNSTGTTAKVWSHDKSADGDRFPMYHNKTRVGQSANVTSLAGSAMTIKTIQHGVSVLNGKDVPPCRDGYFKLITNPTTAYQLTTSSGFKGWFSPTSSERALENPAEVGVVANVRIMTSNLAYSFRLSGDTLATSSGHLNCSLLFGDEAYGTAMIAGESGEKGFNFYLKQSGLESTNDPASKIKQAAWSILGVGKVLNKSAGLWILTTEFQG
jgi:N4-gp56 family major capsid protein